MHTEVRNELVPQKLSGALSIVLGLLVFTAFLNYVDRANLSIAAPMVKDELRLSASQLGFLLSSFYWTYGLSQIFAGWLVDRFRVNWVLAAGFFLWSAATGITGVLHGFVALFLVRLVLGVGESVAYPAYSRILVQHFPSSHRSRANAALAAGLSCGPAFGMLAGGVLMSRFGWRSFFVVLGVASLLWLIPWLRWMPRSPTVAVSEHSGASPGIVEILKQRSAWGTFFALFCVNYKLYSLVSWLPFYLMRERHFSMDAMGEIGGAVFLTQALGSVLCGRYADRWLVAGATSTRVRKTFLIVGASGGGTCLFASTWVGNVGCIALLILTAVLLSMSASNMWATTQTLAGPHASGRWTGLQCAFANLSGVVASWLTGYILERTGHFSWAFAVVMAVGLMGALCWTYVVEPSSRCCGERRRWWRRVGLYPSWFRRERDCMSTENSKTGYALGYTTAEHDRLIRQAAQIEPILERLFREAGIGPGQRVLDLGSGVGDVSMLAARLVGPSGEVVGIERDASSIAVATRRVAEAGFRNVSFTQTDASQIASAKPFDAAVGRFILMFLPDPAAVLRSLAALVRPGGVLAFQEPSWLPFLGLASPLPLWSKVVSLIHETFRRSGVNVEMGPDLHRVFQETGLPVPNVFLETPVGSDLAFSRVIPEVLESLRPLAEQHDVSLDAVGDFATLADRVQEEINAAKAIVSWVPLLGAWVRKPS
jgi:ACS family D-galactonate transporter-like MFS transporter